MGMTLYQFDFLREQQRLLDAHILNGRSYDEEMATKMKIARFVELGELLNDLPSLFKYWKHTAKDNRDKALFEYVDVLHFQLSLLNYYRITTDKYCDYEYLQFFVKRMKRLHHEQDLYHMLQLITCAQDESKATSNLLKLGIMLGFTWEEIYTTYMIKNQINHARQDEGY